MKSIFAALLFAITVSAAAPTFANEALAKNNGCMSCHAVDKKILGPSFKEIGKRYNGDKSAENRLLDRVKKGTVATGGQKWGTIPMSPQPALKDENNRTLVRWILSGAK